MPETKIIATTQRLRIRTWKEEDLIPFAAINNDARVMKYFPKQLDERESAAFIDRMNQLFDAKGYCYFAVDELSTGTFIGFIGLSPRKLPFFSTPQVDIGWRLSPTVWGRGYATEGANAVVSFAKHQIGLKEIISIATAQNTTSIAVMKKIGMIYQRKFNFEALEDFPSLKQCVLFKKLL
jgi:RimJ/RimL family protein N-acetyltransferase